MMNKKGSALHVSDGTIKAIMKFLDALTFISAFVLPFFVGIENFAGRLFSFLAFAFWTFFAVLWKDKLHYSRKLIWFMAIVAIVALISLFIPGGVLFPQIEEALKPYLG